MLKSASMNGFTPEDPDLDADFQALRWFPLPSEAIAK